MSEIRRVRRPYSLRLSHHGASNSGDSAGHGRMPAARSARIGRACRALPPTAGLKVETGRMMIFRPEHRSLIRCCKQRSNQQKAWSMRPRRRVGLPILLHGRSPFAWLLSGIPWRRRDQESWQSDKASPGVQAGVGANLSRPIGEAVGAADSLRRKDSRVPMPRRLIGDLPRPRKPPGRAIRATYRVGMSRPASSLPR